MSNVVFSIYVDGTALRQFIVGMQVRQAFGSHTLVILTTRIDGGPVSQQTFLPEGTPVQISWGWASARASTWYGYCHHAETGQRGTLQYILIGTSDVLNSGGTDSWTSVSDSYVVRSIATDAGFRSFIHATPATDHYVAQSGDTDFQLLNRLAADNGYDLWIDGASLYFTSPREVLLSPWIRSVPLYTWNNSAVDTASNLKITQGANTPLGGIAARRVAYGLDATTGQLTQAVSNPTGSTRTLVVPGSQADSYARAWADATAESGRNDAWITATVDLFGDVRVAPGTLVRLAGNAVPSGSEGLWMVRQAVHQLDLLGNGKYTIAATLTRNSQVDYQISAVQQLDPTSEFGFCHLQNGRWRSELLQEVTYGR